jgi:hypothetical protein
MTTTKPRISYTASKDTVSFILNNRFRTVLLGTDRGQKVMAALQAPDQDLDLIAQLADIPAYLVRATSGRVQVDDQGSIRLDGAVVDYGLTNVILRLVKEGHDFSHLAKFLENVSANPDQNVAPHLYSFLEKGSMPITPDGQFHAFKRVGADYRSLHSGAEECTVECLLSVTDPGYFNSYKVTGQIPHPLNSRVSMDRSLCDADRNRTCSVGLHACSFDYLRHYSGGSGHVLIVKINPKDVTAIPGDYNDTKLRCCAMEVVGEVPETEANGFFKHLVDDRFTRAQDDGVIYPDAEDEEGLLELTVDEEVEEEEEETMSLDEVVGLATEDGMNSASEHASFESDYTLGDRFPEVPDVFETAYAVAYCESYVKHFELNPYHSKAALDIGYKDGGKQALEDRQDCDAFAPAPSLGEHADAVPDEDAYSSGFITGYLAVWKTGIGA